MGDQEKSPHRRLGRTGLKVSPFCLGTMQFGWTADRERSFAILDEAVESGCNFIDTADIYSGRAGRSEEIIGAWLKQTDRRREDLILATKVRGSMGAQPTRAGLSRHHIFDAIGESLNRLQTDYVDLYQVHWPDEETPLEETLSALTDLVHQGRVRYIGCSNFPAWLLAKALWISDVRQLCRFETLQPHYNLVHRAEFERELDPLCRDQQVGVLPYSPLAGGFLTGKYRANTPLPSSARAERIERRYGNEFGYGVIAALEAVASEQEAALSQIAIAWLLTHPAVSATIIGANSVEQLRETVAGVNIRLSDDQKKKLDQASDWRD